MKNNHLFEEAVTLPVEMRAELMEKLLLSFHPTKKNIDKMWGMEAEKRVKEIKNGKVKVIPGDEVFKKVHKRLAT